MWKDPAVPRTAVQMIPVDREARFMVMHRSNNVRSARNVWSFPSGMHEIGNKLEDEVHRELHEEYDLKVIASQLIGVYENVAGDKDATEQYHWVIAVYGAYVANVTSALNKEPDKHDEMKFLKLQDFGPQFLQDHPFHDSFDTWAGQRYKQVVYDLGRLIARMK